MIDPRFLEMVEAGALVVVNHSGGKDSMAPAGAYQADMAFAASQAASGLGRGHPGAAPRAGRP